MSNKIKVSPIKAHRHGWPYLPEWKYQETDAALALLDDAIEAAQTKEIGEKSIKEKNPKILEPFFGTIAPEKCIEMYDQGMSCCAIARRMKVPTNRVYYALRNAGHKLRRRGRPKKDLDNN